MVMLVQKVVLRARLQIKYGNKVSLVRRPPKTFEVIKPGYNVLAIVCNELPNDY